MVIKRVCTQRFVQALGGDIPKASFAQGQIVKNHAALLSAPAESPATWVSWLVAFKIMPGRTSTNLKIFPPPIYLINFLQYLIDFIQVYRFWVILPTPPLNIGFVLFVLGVFHCF